MRLQIRYSTVIFSFFIFLSLGAHAQSKAYQRKKPAPPAESVKADASKDGAKKDEKKAVADADAAPAKPGSEKLDIQELEQKYWAPKDTDFSVVQNRTYSKAKRVAASLLYGPVVNDPFNSGFTAALNVNYYFDERYGVELMYQASNLKDSDDVDNFRTLSLGGTRPDFNRDLGFYGVGFNWVPFYAKMSFLGQKIIYFDMQFTPLLGMTSFEQQSDTISPKKSAFAYGVDVTQYFFFSKNFAVRVNLHNRFYKADILKYSDGTVHHKGQNTTTTMFLMGMTYFF